MLDIQYEQGFVWHLCKHNCMILTLHIFALPSFFNIFTDKSYLGNENVHKTLNSLEKNIFVSSES